MRLHTRIYIHFLALLIIVGLLASAISLTGARGAFMRDLVGRIARHSATLVGEVQSQPDVLKSRLLGLGEDFDVDVTFRKLTGEVIAHVGAELPAPAPEAVAVIVQGRVVQKRVLRRIATALVIDPRSRQPTGLLSVALRHRLRWDWLYRPVLFVLAALALVALGTKPLAKRIAEPLVRLTSAARRLGDGDLRFRLPLGVAQDLPPAKNPDELVQLTRAFNDMAERLASMVRSEKELLANLAHELHTPLARMRRALATNMDSKPVWCSDIEADVGELEAVLKDVSTSGRMEASGLRSHMQQIDLRSLFQDLARRTTQIPAFKYAEPHIEVDAAVPETIEADATLLNRALWNLIDNATKYGVPPITLAAAVSGNVLTISVIDAGPGIPEGKREHVLEPFARLGHAGSDSNGSAGTDGSRTTDTSGEPTGEGSGIGLTLSRRIAVAHGGTLRVVEPPAGKGCRVDLTIPLDPLPGQVG